MLAIRVEAESVVTAATSASTLIIAIGAKV